MSNAITLRDHIRPLSIFDDFFKEDFFKFPLNIKMPEIKNQFELKETKKAYELKGNLKGFKKDDISVEISNGFVNISGRTNTKKGNTEYSSSFCRSFNLPEDIDEAKIKASFKRGKFSLIMPKRKNLEKENSKKIKIA